MCAKLEGEGSCPCMKLYLPKIIVHIISMKIN